ncbi:MAG TPA: hypothetical protein VJ625_12625 [Propionibacteriaceae bacterium]|nr:hypothetical protein [Propionibacteriaceae bacterium]
MNISSRESPTVRIDPPSANRGYPGAVAILNGILTGGGGLNAVEIERAITGTKART